ncbi:structural maintenance of chromosomes domain-containing protein isoform X1 [Tripterygium wilfordii]|uniref:Structural maintenance of chromosomes domain-containing protein isoform X1 n=1 Tax=Tripterygium wilfordii TaxID=458696 RepID=A0A7J7CA20_TRIWF|nr:protein FLX-like 1 [Tripterygium wilfordii]KAF5730775.1 structural maintenance of chromosomes domain-containing protein isoform X1 [Tripterygium wilfordii]
MSRRNRGPPLPMKGGRHTGLPAMDEIPYDRIPPHPALLEELRESQFGMGGNRGFPPHSAMIEEHLALQNQDIHNLLEDNQRLATTHVALKQELETTHHKLQQMAHFADSLRAETDAQMRELYDKSARLEMDVRGVNSMRSELAHFNSDIKELTEGRQELTGRVQMMSQDLARVTADLQQVPALKTEIENMKLELQRARAAIEYEKKGYAENYQHGQVMENKLISMARELEKLRAEISNSEKRARAAAGFVNPDAGYGADYGNPEISYARNSYPSGYGLNTVQNNAQSFPPYGAGAGPGPWGAYDMQRARENR